jgi:hypothetical protein
MYLFVVGVEATGGGHPSGEPFMLFPFLTELDEFIVKRSTRNVEDLKNMN